MKHAGKDQPTLETYETLVNYFAFLHTHGVITFFVHLQ